MRFFIWCSSWGVWFLGSCRVWVSWVWGVLFLCESRFSIISMLSESCGNFFCLWVMKCMKLELKVELCKVSVIVLG